MISLLVIALCAVLNRVRGGGFYADRLPGHARLWATGGLFAALMLAGGWPGVWTGWPLALAWSVGYLAWAALPLNRWDVLGRVLQHKPPIVGERIIEEIADILSEMTGLLSSAPLLVREFCGVLPALSAVAIVAGPGWLPLLTPVYALAAVLLTELAHRIAPGRFRPWSEPFVGALWGGLIVITL